MHASASLPWRRAANSCKCVRSAFLHLSQRAYVSACQCAHKSFPDWCDGDNHIQKAQKSWELKMAAKRWAVADKKININSGQNSEGEPSVFFVMVQKCHKQIDYKCDVAAWQKDTHTQGNSLCALSPCKQHADHLAAATVVKQTQYLLGANDPSRRRKHRGQWSQSYLQCVLWEWLRLEDIHYRAGSDREGLQGPGSCVGTVWMSYPLVSLWLPPTQGSIQREWEQMFPYVAPRARAVVTG